jgi:hypothetical protein
MPRRAHVTILLAAGGVCASAAALEAQSVYPTPEEYAVRAAAAEAAPLFQSREPLVMTLRTDVEWLRRERNDTLEIEGTATFVDLDGSTVTRPVDVRVRGNFRLSPDNCSFPPLRLDFPRGEMDGTVFEGENQLKLVTPCDDRRDDYQRYVYDEYLAYRVHHLITPYSFRVRLVEITYEDVEGDYDTRTKIGFLIESDERMAERNRATYEEDIPLLDPRFTDGRQSVIAAVFNYMIGMLDWSAVELHNVRAIRTEDGRYVPVPYDFDFSGIVDARYAVPPPDIAAQHRIRTVRQRLFRGFCRPELEHGWVSELFLSKRAEIEELYRSFELFDGADPAQDAIEYLGDFWEVMEDPDDFEAEIVRDCRALPGGG